MSGYDQFFKKAQSVRKDEGAALFPRRGPSERTAREMDSHWKQIENERRRLNQAPKNTNGPRARSIPQNKSLSRSTKPQPVERVKPSRMDRLKSVPVGSLAVLSCLAGFLMFGPYGLNDAERLWKSWELRAFSMAGASSEQEKSPSQEGKNGASGSEKSAKNSATPGERGSTESNANKSWTQEEIALFKNLEQRKLQLDRRENDLNRMEEELQKQREEVEAKLKALEDTRKKIAGQLESRVQMDQEKLDRLVTFYTNMKPQQAANVFKDLNEDLVVEVLGKMKQKSVADIMNLLPPEKAQKISEKFAGYKRASND